MLEKKRKKKTNGMNGRDVSLEELARLVVERLAVRLGMSHAQHVDVRKGAMPYRLVDLVQTVERDHAANDLLELRPRLIEHDLSWFERHLSLSL